MTFLHHLNAVPLWVVTLAFAMVLMLSMAIGRWLRRFVSVDPATVGSGQLVVGAVSLLSLLVGFTFSLALNRHDERRNLLLEEANAIRALHRSLVHVEEPGRTEIGDALEGYARGRLAFVQSNLFDQEAQQGVRSVERERLNQVVAEVVPRSHTGVNQAQILVAATRILDAGTRMEMAMLSHVPARVVLVIYMLSTGSALLIGLSLGGHLRQLWLAAAIWSVLLSIALFTIVDLDAPHWGSIRLDTGPLEVAVRTTAGG